MDLCPGSDDTVDGDADGRPDGCEPCPDDPDDDAYEPQLPAAHDSRVSAVNAEQAREAGFSCMQVKSAGIVQTAKEAREAG